MDSRKFDIEITLLSFKVELRMFYAINEELMMLLNDEKLNSFNKYMKASFKYRNIVSNINNLLATWEQQLYLFIYTFYNKKINNYYENLKKEFNKQVCLYSDMFDKIEEYRNLVNVLKHGTSSKSYINLKNINSEFLLPNSEYEYLGKGLSFNIPILNISSNTIKEIVETLDDFWEKLKNAIKI